MSNSMVSRRNALRTLGAGALAAVGTSISLLPAAAARAGMPAEAQFNGGPPRRRRGSILMDGHVHVTDKIFWLGVDPWQPTPTNTGWDYARAAAAGINVIIENPSPYGYWSYNMTPKHILRLFETFHRFIEANEDKMGLALTAGDARRIAASGRMAVFLSCESGWDHEGDIDVLRALYRFGLRAVQFSSQSGFNAFSDVQAGLPSGGAHWSGINSQGLALVEEMNSLGIVIDITHASTAAQAQIIEVSRAPVIASHVAVASVSGPGGLTDDLIVALASKGGMLGVHGGASSIGVRYKQWVATNPAKAALLGKPLSDMVNYRPSFVRSPDVSNYGDFIARVDQESGDRTRAVFVPFGDDPVALAAVPTPDEWAELVHYVINLVGADHVGIGLDMFGGRSGVPQDASGYPLLVDAIRRITTPKNVEMVVGENWLRVIEQVQGFAHRDEREHRESRVDKDARERRAREASPAHHREALASDMSSASSTRCC